MFVAASVTSVFSVASSPHIGSTGVNSCFFLSKLPALTLSGTGPSASMSPGLTAAGQQFLQRADDRSAARWGRKGPQPTLLRAERPPVRAAQGLGHLQGWAPTAPGGAGAHRLRARSFLRAADRDPQPRCSGGSRSACGAPLAARDAEELRAGPSRRAAGAAPAPGRRRGPAGWARPRPLGPPRSWAPSDPCWGPAEDGEGRAGPRDPCAGPGVVEQEEGRCGMAGMVERRLGKAIAFTSFATFSLCDTG